MQGVFVRLTRDISTLLDSTNMDFVCIQRTSIHWYKMLEWHVLVLSACHLFAFGIFRKLELPMEVPLFGKTMPLKIKVSLWVWYQTTWLISKVHQPPRIWWWICNFRKLSSGWWKKVENLFKGATKITVNVDYLMLMKRYKNMQCIHGRSPFL